MHKSEQHLPDDWYQTQINGDLWTIYLTDNDDDVIASEDAGAETDFDKREIYVRPSDLELGTLLHEIWHAFAGYCYLVDTDVDVADAEEVAASLFADRGQTMLDKAKEITDALIRIRDAAK
jgi:hypothetical protein